MACSDPMGTQPSLPINPWEAQALDHQFPEKSMPDRDDKSLVPRSQLRQHENTIFYPGLYSSTGYDLMDILLRVTCRPNPQIDLGAIDCSVGILLCDLNHPDHPIIYASDSFCQLTGYAQSELLGRNCRFLQHPLGQKSVDFDSTAVSRMRQAIDARQEIQMKLVNFTKSGRQFNNVLSIIPLDVDSSGHQYAVGFSVEID